MEGFITIRLRRRDPSQGSLPDMGFDANWLEKELPNLPYTDKDGNKSTPIADKYEVVECATALRRPGTSSATPGGAP